MSILTEQQQRAAEEAYIYSKLSQGDRTIKLNRSTIEDGMAQLRAALEQLQEDCDHPLIARKHKNDGWSNDWDRTAAHWTQHECTLCDRRWRTSQSWKYLGGKEGQPNDETAVPEGEKYEGNIL